MHRPRRKHRLSCVALGNRSHSCPATAECPIRVHQRKGDEHARKRYGQDYHAPNLKQCIRRAGRGRGWRAEEVTARHGAYTATGLSRFAGRGAPLWGKVSPVVVEVGAPTAARKAGVLAHLRADREQKTRFAAGRGDPGNHRGQSITALQKKPSPSEEDRRG